ncbi:MAG: phosphopantetheine-binding protein [Bdellovibrionota bacterium]
MSEMVSSELLAELRNGLKKMVIKECNVEGFTPEQIDDDDPVIGGKMPLDSLDAVEIVAALERSFDIRLESAGASRKIFKSFEVMADYVVQNATPEKVRAFVRSA